MEGQYGKEFCGLKDLRHKLVRLQHHEKVYTRSLEECVTPKGLRLKKMPMLGKMSDDFMRRWRNVLFEAERRLLKLLENDVKQRQVKVGSLFQKRTGELTLLRGDEVVKSWLRTLEILESRWEEDLAKKRRKKFAAWMSGRAKRRRRALSVGAIKNLRELVKQNQEYNEQRGEDAVAVNEVNQDNELDKTKNEYSEGQVRVTDGARNKFVSKNVVNLSDRELNGGGDFSSG